MLFSLLVSIYSSRVVLHALGATDYGIYNVVGGVVAMFSIISSSLSSASSRFFTFELGKGDDGRLADTFSSSLKIQFILAAVVFILAEVIGVWFLNNKMTIPTERMGAANVVLQCALVSFITSMLIVPYNSAVIAHEKFDFYSITGIGEVFLKLAIALFLAYAAFSGDKLIIYAFLLLCSTLAIQIAVLLFCRINFKECRYRKIQDKSIAKEMVSFAGWQVFGSGVQLLNGHGVNIVMNIFGGPVVNAARGLAVTVNNCIGRFVTNFSLALNPQITKAYASDDSDYMVSLVKRGARFSVYIFLLLAIPVFLEADFLINLWLVEVPPHTVNFVKLVLLVSYSDILSAILGMAINSTGKIRNYQIVVSAVLSLNFGFSYLVLKNGGTPESTYFLAIAAAFGALVVRLLFVKKQIGISIGDYIRTVYLNIFVVTAISLIIPVFLVRIMESGWIRFICVVLVSVICTSLSVLFIGCDGGERRFILDYAIKFISKFGINISNGKK